MRRILHPACDLLAILRNLTNGGPHATLAHSMRAAVIELNAVRAGIFDPANNILPGLLSRFHHRRYDNGTIRPGALDLSNLAQVDFERAIGNQLDIINREHLLRSVVPGAV